MTSPVNPTSSQALCPYSLSSKAVLSSFGYLAIASTTLALSEVFFNPEFMESTYRKDLNNCPNHFRSNMTLGDKHTLRKRICSFECGCSHYNTAMVIKYSLVGLSVGSAIAAIGVFAKGIHRRVIEAQPLLP